MPELKTGFVRQCARLGLVPRRPRPGGPTHRRAGLTAVGAAAALALVSMAGCAKMGAALGQQWIVVQFSPNTSAATARHVTQACSHVPNLLLAPIRPTTADPGMIDSARYDATNATEANMAELQRCLQRFPSFQGFNLVQAGDS